MEKLILTCGRFTPRLGESAEARMRALENYVAEMSEALELLVTRLGQMQASAVTATATTTATAAEQEG